MKFLFKVVYETICLFYAKICTAFENYFFRRNFKSKSLLDKDGFLKITKKSKLNISKQRFDFVLKYNEKSFYSNKYQKKFILSQEKLNSIVKLIFDRQFCNFLTSLTDLSIVLISLVLIRTFLS